MFVHSIKTDSMICDFQLVYESDGRMMMDLYAFGQVKEPGFLEVEAVVSCIDCGLIRVSCENYEKLENKLRQASRDICLLEQHSKKMLGLMETLVKKCEQFESRLKEGIVSLVDVKENFEALTDVIAYRRLADAGSDYLTTRIGTEGIAAMRLPSYLVLLQKVTKKLGCNSTKKDLEKFIWEYAYLESFSVLENKYENIDFMMEWIKDKSDSGDRIDELHLDYCPPVNKSREEQIFYDLSWYSELKHIYQLRVLRNFRKYMQLHGLDVIKTDARSLFGNV